MSFLGVKSQCVVSSELVGEFLTKDLERVMSRIISKMIEEAKANLAGKMKEHLDNMVKNVSIKVNENGDVIVVLKSSDRMTP